MGVWGRLSPPPISQSIDLWGPVSWGIPDSFSPEGQLTRLQLELTEGGPWGRALMLYTIKCILVAPAAGDPLPQASPVLPSF